MKKAVIILTLLSFVIAAPFAIAQGKAKDDTKVNCCIKGDCKEMLKAECKKAKGKVVKDCSKCKPAKMKTR